jgi:response regulator RpfG family c-di-GMP phosphodiesterase
MIEKPILLLLADDDNDDRMFFKDALLELKLSVNLTLVENGTELMKLLTDNTYVKPHVIFLDINMPRKNGIECLREIKCNDTLKEIPIIMFTTAYDTELVNTLYSGGVQYFIRKPNNFSELKSVIEKAISLIELDSKSQPGLEDFVLYK